MTILDAKEKFLYPVGLVAIVAIGYFPITRIMIRQGDFPNHIGRAVALTHGELVVPHILFHALTAEFILLGFTPASPPWRRRLG